MDKSSPFDRIGFEGATSIALALYDRVMASDELEPYFTGVDMQRLIEHQAHFIASIMGGPVSYSDEELRMVHAPLAIGHETFELMLAALQDVLRMHDLAKEDADCIIEAFRRRRPAIVTSRKRSGPRVA